MHPEAVPLSPKDKMQVKPAVPATKVDWNIDPAVWVDEHGDYLYRFALARVRDASVAEDLVQEGLLAALQSMSTYSGKASERTWLTSIVRHKILDHFRRSSRQVQFTDADLDLSESEKFFGKKGAVVIRTERFAPARSPSVRPTVAPFQGIRTVVRAHLKELSSRLPAISVRSSRSPVKVAPSATVSSQVRPRST